ncbi:hypothetical protein KFE98_03260 [bacterium SCSIO 12741]|nr:hypothetical protein KFE98_03260 [bacterium SCSIO 12741]
MKTLVLVLLCLCVQVTMAQNPINQMFKDMPEGEHKLRYKNGTVRSKWVIKNGNLDGAYLDYFKNGELRSETLFKDGKLHGANYVYDKNGRVKIEEYHRNDTLVYYKEYTYYKSGTVRSKLTLYNHSENYTNLSVHTSDSKPGSLRFDPNKAFTEGNNSGSYVEYYESGEIRLREILLDRYVQEKSVEYYRNGQVFRDKEYKDGKQHGASHVYDEKGQLIRVENWENGRKISTSKSDEGTNAQLKPRGNIG